MKNYTDIDQSKKLAKILPLESADMWYSYYGNTKYNPTIAYKGQQWFLCQIRNSLHDDIPCWSLTALLGVLPNNKNISTNLSRGGWKIEPVEYIDKWFCEYEDEIDEDSPCKGFTVSADNPVDACVAMVEKLHKLKML